MTEPEYLHPDYPPELKALLARIKYHPRLSIAEKNLIDLAYMKCSLLSDRDYQTLERLAIIGDANNPNGNPIQEVLHG